MALAIATAATATLAESSGSCSVESARYVLRADRTVSLSFHAAPGSDIWANGLAAEVLLPPIP
ncbi:hypothetical protein [Sphingomonas aracearum]|uniref:Uncharacterized protein n=1 Tax=Sphingomonas aracearum TaxID=2283317 RepID=A0A369VXE1_9SPHN|nr:hypothetical protein [Sphingomonas aracearum]RDE06257.1 hypothetical protein DVW87_00540 [Sphingomonas aracearum]